MHDRRILILAVLMINFYIVLACVKYSFVREDGVELQDHVITTMTTPYVEICWDKCVWIMNCFSINVRNNSFGTIDCDLNNSSKTARSGSLVPRQGSQYYQMGDTNVIGCDKYKCKRKEALADDWYRLDNAVMKLFIENKNWMDARIHCKSLGGDLLSILTSYENDFIKDVLAKNITQTKNLSELPGIVAYWPLDGTDPDVTLKGDPGAARYEVIDGERALYLSGNRSYGEVPAVVFNPEGYTFMLWIKPGNQSENTVIFSDWQGPNNFKVLIKRDVGGVKFDLMSENSRFFSNYHNPRSVNIENKWNNVAFLWNKSNQEIKIVFNAREIKLKKINITSDVRSPSHPHFHLGIKGDLLPNIEESYHGYMKHLMIFNKTLTLDEIQTAMYYSKQGHWIGLQAKSANRCLWSDRTKSQFTSFPTFYWFNSHLPGGAACVIFGPEGKWLKKPCNKKQTFICNNRLV